MQKKELSNTEVADLVENISLQKNISFFNAELLQPFEFKFNIFPLIIYVTN